MTTVGANGETQSAEITQTGTKSQESSNKVTEDDWLISIENFKVDETTKKPQIERVPSLLRQSNSDENCYDPIVVSIGPYHHGKAGLEAFEQLKIPIAQKLCHDRCNLVSIRQLYEAVANVGKSARECYAKGSTENFGDELFNRIMFLDACFALHFMFILKDENDSNGTEKEQKVHPRLYMGYYQSLMLRDLFLLENQIPLLVLNVLMNFMLDIERQKELIQNFLEWHSISKSWDAPMELDLDGSPHLLHLIWKHLAFRQNTNTAFRGEWGLWESYRKVTELESAGIHVKPSQTGTLTHVEFKSHPTSGTLILPKIFIDDSTKPLLLNLLAYEMCPHGPSDLAITSYVCLMDNLIDDADDVKQLRKSKVLVNYLGSDQELAQFFNKIAIDLIPDPRYAEVKKRIVDHCRSTVQAWMAESIHKYFSSPWNLWTLLGALLGLVLTMVQTYFAVYTYHTPER